MRIETWMCVMYILCNKYINRYPPTYPGGGRYELLKMKDRLPSLHDGVINDLSINLKSHHTRKRWR